MTNVYELENVIKEIWENNEEIKRYSLSLVESVPGQISSVLRSKGGVIKY